ncbi:MAG: glycosyltransferase family 2 protein, partial [Sphingobacteriia bacterium]|nr:glycosyltransferase family 2 protein [Candidatus Fonsibacter lacus]
MIKKPKNINTWLDHHRNLGISRFYIRLEDTPELETILQSQKDVVVQIGKSTGENEYNEIQVRQRKMMNEALKSAKTDNIQWIIHIDSDELLVG